MKLYLWGLESSGHPISGESIALAWYLQCNKCDSQVDIVFGNNTDMSPLGRLPVLHLGHENNTDNTGIEYVHGFEDIVMKLFPKVRDEYTTTQKLMEKSAFSILNSDLRLLNEYQLYLDKKNYVEYTRKEFSKLFYFPFNYNSAYELRNKAKQDCAHLEYLSTDDNEDIDDITKNENTEDYELAQSKTFKIQGMKKRQQAEELKSIRLNRKYMKALVDFLDQWKDVSSELPDTSPAFYLFHAYMYVQLIVLPNGKDICEYLEEKKGKEYLDDLVGHCERYQSKIAHKLNVRSPTFKEQGNLISSALYKLNI